MKKNGFTLVELMVSVTILLIILGTIGLITTSFMDTYTAGIRNEEGGSKVQTYFSYIMSDLTPLDEENEENFVEIKKYGTPTNKIEIKRSWYDNKENENVVYTFSNGEVLRKEYREGSEVGDGSRILARTKNFDLRGIGLRVSKSSLEGLKKVTDREEYTPVLESDLQNGIKLGWDKENEDAERFIYYIEPVMDVNDGSKTQEFSRGYGLRFAPEIEKSDDNEDGDDPFMGVIAMSNGVLKFDKGYTKKNRSEKLKIVSITQNDAPDGKNTCKEIKGDGNNNSPCEIDEPGPKYNIPIVSLSPGKKKGNTYKPGKYGEIKITNNGSKFKQGVYQVEKLLIESNKNLKLEGNVKIYIGDGGIDISSSGSINRGGTPSQLLIVSGKNNIQVKERSKVKGFIYSENGVIDMDKRAEIHGAVISNKEVKLLENAFIEYYPCDAKVFTKDHIEQVDKVWW